MKGPWMRWLPLVAFAVLLGFLGVGLHLKPREIPSALLDRPLPAFRLAALHAPDTIVTPEALKGKVWMLNVWASWCAACQDEHPVLVDFARRQTVPLIGLNYKDKREDALVWLGKYGNPYRTSLSDTDGRVGIELGVYGVPETFVIDREGVIRYKQIGAVTPEALRDTIIPLLARLGA
ncbi:MAG: DsbE family thiol:disulfide interchange protein [Pseudomonadota bacterium]